MCETFFGELSSDVLSMLLRLTKSSLFSENIQWTNSAPARWPSILVVGLQLTRPDCGHHVYTAVAQYSNTDRYLTQHWRLYQWSLGFKYIGPAGTPLGPSEQTPTPPESVHSLAPAEGYLLTWLDIWHLSAISFLLHSLRYKLALFPVVFRC